MKDHSRSVEGSCHCGNVKFTALLNLSNLIRCNCTICSKLGALWAFAPMSVLELQCAETAYGSYQFGEKTLDHHFCKNCGIQTFADGVAPDGTPTVGINVRCLDGIDINAIPVSDYDGLNA